MGSQTSLLCAEAAGGRWVMRPDGSLAWEDRAQCCACMPKADPTSDTVRVDIGKLSMELAATMPPMERVVQAEAEQRRSIPWQDSENPPMDQDNLSPQLCPCPKRSSP